MRTLPLLALLLPACLPALPGDPPKDDPPGESGVTDTGRVDTGEVDTGDSGQTPTGSAPTVTDITLDPAQPRVTDALVVRAEVQDPDGDLLMVGATWTVNGVEPPDGTVVAEQDGDTDRTWVATFPSMDLARRGDTLAVEFLAMDEAGNVTLADPVSTRVLNSDPAVPTPEVYPETPDQDTELTCLSLAPTDADGDTLSTTFAWFVDGVELTGQEGVTLAAGTVSHGSDVSCETHVSDGAGGIVRATSTPVRVIDRTPTLDTVELTPADPRAGEPVLCVPIGAVDPDADPIVARYTFTGDALSVSLDGDETGMELPWSAFSLVRGDTVTCTVELFVDGEGVTSATSTPVTVANTPPSADSLTLTPHDGQAWRVGSWFDCAMVGFEDLDGDTPSDDTACTCSVTTASGDVVPFDATTEPLPEAGTLDCFADAFDGYDAGNRVTASESVTWAPALLDVRFEPAPITAASGLWLTYAVDDPDSRDVTVDIHWYRKRPGATTWILLQSGQDATLAGPLLRDDQVYAVLIPSDETGAGVTYETRPVTVLDAPTPVASVSVTQQASNDTTQGARPDLRCDATANDADNDTLYLHVAWQRDGEPIDPTDSNVVNTTIHAGSQASADSVVSGAATNPGETWTCQVWTTADAGRVGIDPTDDPTGWTGPGEASIDLPHVRGEHVSLAGRDFRWLPADTFTMGCTALNGGCTGEDRPTHRVTLTRDVWIAEAEVTQPDFTALMAGNNPSTWGPASSAVDCQNAGNTCPVDSVSWHDAARYANALSRSEGLPECYACDPSDTCAVIGDPYDCDGYRLPTEAEWEAAARCGTEDRYAGTDAYLGNSLTGQPGVADVAWYGDNAYGTPRPVREKLPNACGLHDMSGNLAEWTSDGESSYTAFAATDPYRGGAARHVHRGGSWFSPSEVLGAGNLNHVPDLYVWARRFRDPAQPDYRIGFRLARTVPRSVQFPSMNTLPTITSVEIEPSPTAIGETVRCRATAQDRDGDAIRYAFLWEVQDDAGATPHAPTITPVRVSYRDANGVMHVQSEIPARDATGSPTYATAQGQIWTCHVRVTDDPTRSEPRSAEGAAAGWSASMSAETEIVGPGDVVEVGSMSFRWMAPDDLHPSGSPFRMGYGNGAPGHEVTLTRDYALSTTEVTRGQFIELMEYDPAYHGPSGTVQTCLSPDCPVETVTWHQAAAFANAFTELTQPGVAETELCYTCTGTGYDVDCEVNTSLASAYTCEGWRLPTEAEWELAATCGAYTAHAGSDSTDPSAFARLSVGTSLLTSPVATGTLLPNACDLHDMSGNVWEWVHDWSDTYPTGAVTDPGGPATGVKHVIRGAGYTNAATDTTRTERSAMLPETAAPYIGFRLARSIPR